MSVSEKMQAFWHDVKDAAPVVAPERHRATLPEEDCPETMVDQVAGVPADPAGSIAGRTVVILYRDSKGAQSERQIVCQRLMDQAGHLYIKSWCLARQKARNFRVDRVLQVIDPLSGEVFDPGSAFILAFAPDERSASRFHYGLTPREYAAFNAALNVLAFMARCDGQWHPFEADAIETFATSYWLRCEIAAPLDLGEIGRHVARLAPDAEVFFSSLVTCARHPVLAQVIRRHVAAVIDADGRHHPKEVYWGRQVDELLAEAL